MENVQCIICGEHVAYSDATEYEYEDCYICNVCLAAEIEQEENARREIRTGEVY